MDINKLIEQVIENEREIEKIKKEKNEVLKKCEKFNTNLKKKRCENLEHSKKIRELLKTYNGEICHMGKIVNAYDHKIKTLNVIDLDRALDETSEYAGKDEHLLRIVGNVKNRKKIDGITFTDEKTKKQKHYKF